MLLLRSFRLVRHRSPTTLLEGLCKRLEGEERCQRCFPEVLQKRNSHGRFRVAGGVERRGTPRSGETYRGCFCVAQRSRSAQRFKRRETARFSQKGPSQEGSDTSQQNSFSVLAQSGELLVGGCLLYPKNKSLRIFSIRGIFCFTSLGLALEIRFLFVWLPRGWPKDLVSQLESQQSFALPF